MRKPRLLLLHILFIGVLQWLLAPPTAEADWKLMSKLDAPVGCGYFFDAKNGFIGTGIRNSSTANASIYITTNGGNSWKLTITPQVTNSAVTSIFMRDAYVGYASVFLGLFPTRGTALWKTTDGGYTWFDFTPPGWVNGACVYAVQNSVILTTWYNDGGGGCSKDNGTTWTQIFATGNHINKADQTNGIDFINEQIGIVTVGPAGAFNPLHGLWRTTDAGSTWNRTQDIPEAWSVYGAKGTNMFFTANEGDQGSSSLWSSQDAGVTWNELFTFPNPSTTFTGHIAGKNNTLYLQTDTVSPNGGLYRSDDLGQTWHNIGGPSNSRDSRFIVTGCSGQIVYAFDPYGGVWKTEDGGDGTLASGNEISLSSTNLSAYPGDTLLIPIWLGKTNKLIDYGSYALHLSFNNDILTPNDAVTIGTQSAGATTMVVTDTFSGTNGASIGVTLTNHITTESADYSIPLIYLRARVTLSTERTTLILLDTININNTGTETCSDPSLTFTTLFKCGDSTLYDFMRGARVVDMFSVYPNPAHATVTIEAKANLDNATIELIDLLGAVRRQVRTNFKLKAPQQIDVSNLPDGSYILRIDANGFVKSLMIEKER